ncbi:MAG: AraC family transcriptional regulator, partial [Lachnospiraceae bacterium]|nr:AraC family transcriptional regulator [Lachnospiraceae bacterium]
MNRELLSKLSRVTEEEKRILAGERRIDRSIYMDGTRDVISGDKLLKSGQIITIRPHTRFVAFPEHTHDYVEMVYMCEGETRHEVNGT